MLNVNIALEIVFLIKFQCPLDKTEKSECNIGMLITWNKIRVEKAKCTIYKEGLMVFIENLRCKM
jgi:hypothetical protein